MKRLLLLLLLALPAWRAAAEDFRLLSFNIRYANPEDGADVWENRRDAVAKLIREESDLAGLQEVLPVQRAEIAERCGEFAVLGVGRDPGDKGEASPILFRKERFTALASGTFWLSDTPEIPGSRTWGATLPRVCTWARLRDVKSDAVFFLFNTHLDHQSQPSRARGMELIAQRIRERSGAEPVLLSGDFNMHAENEAFRVATGGGQPLLVSAFDLAGVPAEGTFHGFSGQPAAKAIDFFFLERNRWTLRSMTILKTTYPGHNGQARFVSDHFPIRAVVEPATQ